MVAERIPGNLDYYRLQYCPGILFQETSVIREGPITKGITTMWKNPCLVLFAVSLAVIITASGAVWVNKVVIDTHQLEQSK